MRRLVAFLVALCLVSSAFASAMPVAAQSVTCADFDAWPWAQTVLESDPDKYASSLDPDGNGLACEMLTIHGFSPVLWTDESRPVRSGLRSSTSPMATHSR
jgi:hypothetical protein